MHITPQKALLAALIPTGLFFAGCASVPPPIPEELRYHDPIAGTETASLIGSQENSSWADDFTAYVANVDGKRVMLERKGWSTPIILTAGPRVITAEFQRGVFNSRVEIPFAAEAGHSYRLKFSSDVGFNGRNSYCDFWVEDMQANKAVSGIVRGSISGGGGGGYVPIFIPVK